MRFFEQLTKNSREAGFVASGAVDLDLAKKEFLPHAHEYTRWIKNQQNAEMQYLERGLQHRVDPKSLYEQAQSVFVVLLPYPATPIGNAKTARYARYLRGRDYHKDVKAKLRGALEKTKREFPKLSWKICVDTSSVLERSWAQICGLGWIGKNKMLIHKKHGSYTFIGTALLSERTGREPQPHPNLCGSCEKCLEKCPTQALSLENGLESKKCISYLTIEKRGKFSEEESRSIGNWIAGCDVCQEVCPFNNKVSRPSGSISGPIIEAQYPTDPSQISAITEQDYAQVAAGSSIKRIKRNEIIRNAEAVSRNLASNPHP